MLVASTRARETRALSPLETATIHRCALAQGAPTLARLLATNVLLGSAFGADLDLLNEIAQGLLASYGRRLLQVLEQDPATGRLLGRLLGAL